MAEGQDISEQIRQFSSITGIGSDQARFFVESAGGDLETAMSTFYETVGNTNLGAPTPVQQPTAAAPQPGATPSPAAGPPAPAPTASSGPQTLGGQAAEALPEAWRRPAGGAGGGGSGSRGMATLGSIGSGGASGGRSSGAGRIGTLSDIRNAGGGPMPPGGGHGHGSDDDEDEEEQPPPTQGGTPDLYAGSGLNIQDPNAKKKPKGVVADILKKAKEAGAGPPPGVGPAGPSSGSRYFGGSANTLGSDDVPSRAIPDPSAPPRPTPHFPTGLAVPGAFPPPMFGGNDDDDETSMGDGEELEEVERLLIFWKDGFSIEDGPLMRYDDPKHKEVLDAINSGRAPLDLLGVKFNQKVTVRVQKRLNEDYVPPPKKPMKAFSGGGNRLGSPVPGNLTSATGPAEPSTGSTGSSEGTGRVPPAASNVIFEVDQSMPVASVQIRLGDGSRMVTRFNHSHTVGDIRRQIQASNPALAARPYVLQTTFPSRDLTDESETIKQAGLIGSVVVQRYL